MIDLDQVVLRRADEQVAAAKVDRRWERDSWAIAGEEPARARPVLGNCRAPSCDRRARGTGYCHMHGRRRARGLPLERDSSEPGRRPKRASLGTEPAHAGRAAPAPSRRAPFTPNVHEAP